MTGSDSTGKQQQHPAPTQPSLPWRLGSIAVMSSVGALSRTFLYGLNDVEVHGLDRLTGVLDRRKLQGKERGLLTVCNHVDDPVMWGILPPRYWFDVTNLRWGLGAHDICFKNKTTATFFSLGQVLPTHRLWHSPHGGLYQPTMTQAIKLLSSPSVVPEPEPPSFSTTGLDTFLAPSAYDSNRFAWVHIFPEACCHQSPDSGLRYFKWGVSRLILESEPAPEFIPMFMHGTQHIMPEDRQPRWAPKIGQKVRMVIGEPTDVDKLFGSQRAQWKKLVAKADPATLETNPEAVELRISVAKKVRDEILTLREALGFPAEKDETAALAETWANEPKTKRFKSPVDGNWVNRQ